jgi:hypothetical protein
MDQSELDALYQEYLGRPADPSGIATWSSQDPNAVVAGILGSPEYQASHPSGSGGGGGAPSVDNMQPITDPSSGDTQYQYQDSSGGTVTVDSSGNPVSYTPGASWYQQQYAAHPDAIRSGMNNEQYLALGPLAQTQTINGVQVPITNAYEYQINPQTRALTTNPVDRQQSGGGFLDFMTSPTGALTAMALLGGAGLALPALAGEGALGAGMVDAAGNIIGAGAEGAATGAATGAAGGTSLADIAATQAAEDMAAGAAYPAGSVPTGAGLSGNVYGATGLDAILAEAGLSGLTAADLLKYGIPLSKLLTGSGSSVLGGFTGSKQPTSMAGLNSGYGSGVDSNSGIANLTPGLTNANENYTLTGMPSITESSNPVFSENVNQQAPIMHAATGGSAKNTLFDSEGNYKYDNISDSALTPALTKHNVGYTLAGLPAINKAQGGSIHPEFYSEGGASMANRYVKGKGDGTSDSIPAMLANGEFVIPADVVSGLGNGSNDSGAKVLDEFLKTIRKHKQKHKVDKLPPDSKGALSYLTDAKRKVKA